MNGTKTARSSRPRTGGPLLPLCNHDGDAHQASRRRPVVRAGGGVHEISDKGMCQ